MEGEPKVRPRQLYLPCGKHRSRHRSVQIGKVKAFRRLGFRASGRLFKLIKEFASQ